MASEESEILENLAPKLASIHSIVKKDRFLVADLLF